ncbi:uncharacterized protein EI90DRAFT_2920727, partial [Cantharellus anzutake]|uniref:uncharacterized protein n=1 Tax=Cantharellus anzutake TaxID=1750568 RepID=UPI00190809B6
EEILKSVHYTTDDHGTWCATSCVVRIEDSSEHSFTELLPHECVILPKMLSFKVSHPFSGQSVTVKQTQLPLLPAFCITDYKSQGRMMPKVILNNESAFSIQSTYDITCYMKGQLGFQPG